MNKYVNFYLENFKTDNPFEISSHQNLTLDYLKKYKETKDFRFNLLHKCENFSIRWVLEFPKESWNWGEVAKILKEDDFYKFVNIPVFWYRITDLAPVKFIFDNPELPWKFNTLSGLRKDVGVVFAIKFLERLDPFFWVTFTTRTPFKIIKDHMELPWDFWSITFTSDDMTCENLQLMSDTINVIDWNWFSVSVLTDASLIKKFDKIPWVPSMIDLNESTWEVPKVSKETLIRKWLATTKIQRSWRECISNPNYNVCKKRMKEEFTEFRNTHFARSA
jgi:hypothetical protein